MRIVIADPTQTPSFVFVRINETNDLGGANTDVLQILRLESQDELKLPIYFIGKLCYNCVLKRWLIDQVISNETWECREEAETALMLGNYSIVDFCDE